MTRNIWCRVGAVAVVAVACGALTVTSVAAAATPTVAANNSAATNAAASSKVGGVISTDEVLARAEDWYNRKFSYSVSGGTAWDIGHTRRYRRDCSGFIDLALHMNNDDTTRDFPSETQFRKITPIDAGNHAKLTPDLIHRGDILNDFTDGHAILFAWWAPDHKHFAYYSFGGGNSGVAPPELHRQATFADATLGYESTNIYYVYRYKNIR